MAYCSGKGPTSNLEVSGLPPQFQRGCLPWALSRPDNLFPAPWQFLHAKQGVRRAIRDDDAEPWKSPLKIPVVRVSPAHSHFLPNKRHTGIQHLAAQCRWVQPRENTAKQAQLDTAGPSVSSDPPDNQAVSTQTTERPEEIPKLEIELA